MGRWDKRLDGLEARIPPSDEYPAYPSRSWCGLLSEPPVPEWAYAPVGEQMDEDRGGWSYIAEVYFHVTQEGRVYVNIGYAKGWQEVTPEGLQPVEGLPLDVREEWEAARLTVPGFAPPASREYPLFKSAAGVRYEGPELMGIHTIDHTRWRY